MKDKSIRIIAMVLLMSCSGPTDRQTVQKPPEVRVTVLKREPAGIPVMAAGRITTRDEIKLSFKKGGIIGEILVQEGETVTKDQVLARLKQAEFIAANTQAKLAVEKAERDFTRIGNLYRDSVATLEQYQNAQTALEMARQTLTSTMFNAEYTVIRAPANGRILKKLAAHEEIVGEGMPVILFGSTDSQWVLNTSLSDRDIVRIRLGDSASIRTDAWPDIDFPATVSEISGMADPYTGTFDIELMLERAGKNFAAGLIAEATVFPSDSSMYWLVPVEALIEGTGHEARIYEVVDGKAKELSMHVEAVRGGLLYAREDLGDSLCVIISGHQFIADGTVVQPVF